MQLNVFCSLIKILLNFLSSLQFIFHLHFIYIFFLFSSVDKSQFITDAGSAQNECNKVLNKIIQFNLVFNQFLQILM